MSAFDVSLPTGTYVVAVSGGVDSMTLLDLLAKQPNLKLVVAHFNHGIRPDSDQDKQLVEQVAKQLNLPFVVDYGQLGPGASEAAARKARYQFLHNVRRASGASAIVTAHHQDDLLETALLNLLRGTYRRGLTSLKDRVDVRRPLLTLPKWQILDYAVANKLDWRDDATNQDQRYKRNFIRHQLAPKLDYRQRRALVEQIEKLHTLDEEIEGLLAGQLHLQPAAGVLDRYWFTMLPHNVAKESLALLLRAHGITSYDTKTLERLVTAGKTMPAGRVVDVVKHAKLKIGADKLALVGAER